MKLQYQVLNDLKRIDEKASRLQRDIDLIPIELKKLEDSEKVRRQEFTKVKEQFDATEKKLRGAEGDLREREDRLKKAEGKMMEVKTNEEYQAAIKENENQKKAKGGLEEQVLALFNEVEGQRGKLSEVEKTVKAYEASISEDKNKLQTELNKMRALLKEQTDKRESILGQLRPDTATLYNRLSNQNGGLAVAAAENGMCQSCNIKIRPQLYNEVLGFKAIHRCPNCGKILIIPPKEAVSEGSLATE